MSDIGEKLKITTIGGGTGHFHLLTGLRAAKKEVDTDLDITAIVGMGDSGGSSGKLRDELGVLPAGDSRQCLAALAENPSELRKLFTHRLIGRNGHTALDGHSVGNIMIAGLEQVYGRPKALQMAGELLKITGRVVPVSVEDYHLGIEDDGNIVVGEDLIDKLRIESKNPKVFLEPEPSVTPDAYDAIRTADVIVISAGSLIGSIRANTAIRGVARGIARSRAPVVMPINLVTTPGQTDGYHAVDFVHRVEEDLGPDRVNYVLINNKVPSKEQLQRYKKEGEELVSSSEDRFDEIGAVKIVDDFIAPGERQADGRELPAKYIRHNGVKLAKAIIDIAITNKGIN